MVCVPEDSARPATFSDVPPFAATTVPSIDQSTLITAGSITFTVSVAGLFTGPAGGLVESTGTMRRQMSMTIFSRDTALKAAVASVAYWLFIIELADGRYCPVST